jgi:hypothetical protein
MADGAHSDLLEVLEQEGLSGAFSLVPPPDRAYFIDWIAASTDDDQKRTRIAAVVRSLRR